MDSNLLLKGMFLQICYMYKICKRRHSRRWRVRPTNLDGSDHQHQQKMSLRMRDLDEEQFFLQTRIPRSVFQTLLSLVARELRKPRQQILAEERLILTLLFLGQGVTIQKLAKNYKLGRTTVRNIILETCEILWRVLSPIYVKEPTEEKYKKISEEFQKKWDVPNCVGAIDGREIPIKCPSSAGAVFSTMIMAACDVNYVFTAITVLSTDSQKNGGVFTNSKFGQALISNSLPLPPSTSLAEESSEPFPYFFIDNCVFPLRPNIMRPYPGDNLDRTKRIFNYRILRAHRVIENAFGILTARWRVLASTMEFSPENSKTVVLACVALHNFAMLIDDTSMYCPAMYADWEDEGKIVHKGGWRQDLANAGSPLRSVTSFARNGPKLAPGLRDLLANYMSNEGAVPYQDRFISNAVVTPSSVPIAEQSASYFLENFIEELSDQELLYSYSP